MFYRCEALVDRMDKKPGWERRCKRDASHKIVFGWGIYKQNGVLPKASPPAREFHMNVCSLHAHTISKLLNYNLRVLEINP